MLYIGVRPLNAIKATVGITNRDIVAIVASIRIDIVLELGKYYKLASRRRGY